jgi:hypothetical protein
MVCPRCNNIQIFPAIQKDNLSFQLFTPGYQIYHNYMRPHEGLNGKTPAEKSRIKIEGDNKWITLIQDQNQKITDFFN